MDRILIIGLDCATPQLIFDAWRQELPNLNSLMKEGIYGGLVSTIPPITVPAWISMLTSKDPGQLGFYGFRNRKAYSYDDLYLANASYLKDRALWDYLNEAGLKSIWLGVPQTYPPRKVNGIMVSCFLTPSKAAHYTYPDNIREELDSIAQGDYIIDVRDFRTDEKQWLIEQIYRMTSRRFEVIRHWIRVKPWDIFMFVEMGLDRIHHGFWRYMDKGHRLHEPGHPYEAVIQRYYQYLDKEIGRLLDVVPPETAVMVVSDHGAKTMKGAICINEWLIEKGYLSLKDYPDHPMRLDIALIDWSKTSAWGDGGYYGRLFINMKERESHGVVHKRNYEAFRDRIKEEIEAIPDEAGLPIGTRVFKPEEAYRATKNIPPDLIVYFGDLDWRSAGTVGHRRIHLFENDTGPDDANHSEEGIFILKDGSDRLSGTSLRSGKRIEKVSIYDIAPTVLDFFGLPIPDDMIGKSLYTGKGEGKGTSPDKEKETREEAYSEEQAEAIRRRLEDLGYI